MRTWVTMMMSQRKRRKRNGKQNFLVIFPLFLTDSFNKVDENNLFTI